MARGTAPNTVLGLDTAPGPERYETGSAQSERDRELHLASADGAPADKAASASCEAEIPPVEGFGHVMQGSPAYPGDGIAIPKPTRRLRTRPAKRRHRASTTDIVTATSDEVPTYKRRRVAASGGLKCVAQPTLRSAQKPRTRRTRASGQSTNRRSAGTYTSPPNESQVTDQGDASYQEWPLPDAVLQRIKVNSRAILQLQFTWATPCASQRVQTLATQTGKPISTLPQDYLLGGKDGRTFWSELMAARLGNRKETSSIGK